MHPINRVSVISTGTVEIHPEHVARSRAPMPWWLLTSRRWTEPRPINVYVIEHDSGLVLFDTGQDRASLTDRNYFPRGPLGFLYARLARFAISANETLTLQLAGLGYDIADVKIAVISHLHQDHIGGLGELAHAEIVIHEDELTAARSPVAVMSGYLKKHIFIPGLRWNPINNQRELFSDDSITVIPTPGHTPGSLSMLVRRDGAPPLLFVGDLSYDVELLNEGRIPGVGNRQGLHASTELVHQLVAQHPGIVILAAHDPAARALLDSANPIFPAVAP